MSRQEHEREDLLREATALVERIELSIPGHSEPIFIGFRKEGAASFFFGQHRVYHFNTAGHLRRAYLAGTLYKADEGRLIALERQRLPTETALIRRDLSTEQASALLADLQSLLTQLESALAATAHAITGQFPANTNLIPRIQSWLTAHRANIHFAAKPNVV
jgi:hypothetical protein